MTDSEKQLIEVILPRYALSYFLDECLEERDFWKEVPDIAAMWSSTHDAIHEALESVGHD